ncbi:hypothetical protein [Breoghania sp.]|uniref:hypothetical protein n=1 Tax=Breoghania sp. TaxID=2065378 RepID=UPI002AAB32B4|nr:hypothetical protein [Breoghania sp.]
MTVWTHLTKAQKLDLIRERAASGATGPQVAEEFGISAKYVSGLSAKAGVRFVRSAPARTRAPRAALVNDPDTPVNDQIIDMALKRVDQWFAARGAEAGRSGERGGDVGPASRALRDRLGNIAYVARCRIAHWAATVGDINRVLDWLSAQGEEVV